MLTCCEHAATSSCSPGLGSRQCGKLWEVPRLLFIDVGGGCHARCCACRVFRAENWKFRSCSTLTRWSMSSSCSSSTVVDVPVTTQRCCFACSSRTMSLTCPLCPTTGALGFRFPEQKTVEDLQLQLVIFFEQVVDIPVVAQMQIPMVRFTKRFSSCSTLIRCSMSVVQVQQVLGCRRGEDSRAPTVAAVESLDKVVDMPVVCNDRCRGGAVHQGCERPCDHA